MTKTNPITHIESTARGLDSLRDYKARADQFKRADNCICGGLIALSKEIGLGDPERVFHWGCPHCDPQVKK